MLCSTFGVLLGNFKSLIIVQYILLKWPNGKFEKEMCFCDHDWHKFWILQKGVSVPHKSLTSTYGLWTWPLWYVNYWRSESSNIGLVILNKMLFVLSKPLFFEKLENYDRQTYRQTDRTYILSLLTGD